MAGIIDWTTVAPVIALGWRYVGAGALHSVVIGVRHSYSQARAALLRIYAPSFYATERYTDVEPSLLPFGHAFRNINETPLRRDGYMKRKIK
jgi:hypothetical protein